MKALLPILFLLATFSLEAEERQASPKPRLTTSSDDLLSSRTVDLGERRVTFERIRPLSLPPIPEAPAETPTQEAIEAMSSHVREATKDRRFTFVGATVYVTDEGPEAAKSLVRFWPNQGEAPVSMWVNANMIWLGVTSQYESDEAVYDLMMLPTEYRIDLMQNAARLAGREWEAPKLPDFGSHGTGEFRVIEGNPTAADLAPFKALMKLYRTDKVRLRADYERRVAEARQRRLEREANPPEKKDLRIRYWRLDEPAVKEAIIR